MIKKYSCSSFFLERKWAQGGMSTAIFLINRFDNWYFLNYYRLMKEENGLKKIPYGISDFNDFRKRNLYYVDKTRYIREIEERGKYLFFIRPRRFGKSLFLGILEAYYDIALKDRFDYFFKGTEIHENPTREKNSYLVFKLNFSTVEPGLSQVEDAFLTLIKNTAGSFVSKYEKFLEIDIKEVKKEFNSKKSASEVMNTLLNYCLQEKQQLYVIIDEYDNFANTILSDAGEQEFQKITHGKGFLRTFFNVIKAGTTDIDAPISRLFMTGVSPITLDDVTSGFNIGINISLDPDINEMLGFTHSDVETMIEYYRQKGKIHHSTADLLDIMTAWYNHYRFSRSFQHKMFNPVLVLYFLDRYLTFGEIPESLIDRNARIDYEKLRHLIIIDKKGAVQTNGNFSILQRIIENGSIPSSIETGFSIVELVDHKNFISLLFYFGLLTIRELDERNTPVLSIPNETIKRFYYDYISKSYLETGILSLDMFKYEELFMEMAYRGNWEALVEYIAGRMEASLSLRDLMSGEKAHQVFWNVYLGLGTLYNVYPEKELNQGFADLVMVPLSIQYPGIKYSFLVEFKYIDPSKYEKENSQEAVRKLRVEAETQLNRYSADEKFKKTIGQTILVRLVLIFSGNRLVHSSSV